MYLPLVLFAAIWMSSFKYIIKTFIQWIKLQLNVAIQELFPLSESLIKISPR